MPKTPESDSAFARTKQTLANCPTPPQREEAVRLAIQNGIPLFQIEALLDWLELLLQTESPAPVSIVPRIPDLAQPPSSPISGSG